MKIAQIAPLVESCPPRLYGGTERIVSYLTEELVRRGHDVTLFASGDSCTAARLEPSCEVALRLDPRIKDPIPHHIVMLEKVRALAPEFDVLHFHVDVLHYPFLYSFVDRTVTTLHGRLDLAELKPLYSTYRHAPLISISNNQRGPMPPVNWAGNVYHGLPRDLLSFKAEPRERYLAFLGRISPEKRPDRAIEIATRAGVNLKMAAKVDRVDQPYWDEVIKPLVDSHPNVEFIGEINERQKAKFLGEASALIFPIDWPEPFGLVMIEAMACGTPVIAFRSGSTPEVLEDGVTGFLVDDVEEAATAVARVPSLSRAKVRARFDERFAIERVAEDYLDIYRRLPGVRFASGRIAAAQRTQLVFPSSLTYAKPSARPELERLGPPQAAPVD
jgi:glycosyltransferase involved in cell wall biosynthesis